MDVLLRVATVFVLLLEAAADNPANCECVPNICYTTIQNPVDFKTASEMCKERQGHLMTVRSTVSNDAVHELLFNLFDDFWIGLQFPGGGCSNTSLGLLRGYLWTTEDNNTDFTNWKSNDTVCSPKCVSVSKDQKWTERSCQDKIAGFLCENIYNSTCKPLRTETNESVLYSTPLGFKGEALLALPPGSVATQSSSGIKKICAASVDKWLGPPWNCDIDNGGCDQICNMNNGLVKCSCSPGFKMVANKCKDIDECASGPCEHVCNNMHGGYSCSCHGGYRQSSEDPDKCILYCSSEECRAECSQITGCECPDGYILDERNFCVDIDECGRDSYECDQKCNNTFGSFICSCDSGFYLKDRVRCVRLAQDYPEVSAIATVSSHYIFSSSNYNIDSAFMVKLGVLPLVFIYFQTLCM